MPIGQREGDHAMGWRNVTEEFSEERRHYKNLYLEECEVLDSEAEVSLFIADSPDDDCEVYFSFGIFHGVVYATFADARDKFETMRREIEDERTRNGEPSPEFINSFCERYGVALPNDIFFDIDMDALF